MDYPKPVARPKAPIKPVNTPREQKTAPAKRKPTWVVTLPDGKRVYAQADTEIEALEWTHRVYNVLPMEIKKRVVKHHEHLMDRPFRNLNNLLKGAKS